MRDDNLAYDFSDGTASSTDAAQNAKLRERKQNRDDCHYIFERIHAELTSRGYRCEISTLYPFNITVSAPSRAYPKLAVMRHRTGRFIAGPVGAASTRGSHGSKDEFPIFRCHDREEVLDHVERYVIFTSPQQPGLRDDPEADVHAEHKPRGANTPRWLAIAAATLAIAVAAILMVAN